MSFAKTAPGGSQRWVPGTWRPASPAEARLPAAKPSRAQGPREPPRAVLPPSQPALNRTGTLSSLGTWVQRGHLSKERPSTWDQTYIVEEPPCFVSWSSGCSEGAPVLLVSLWKRHEFIILRLGAGHRPRWARAEVSQGWPPAFCSELEGEDPIPVLSSFPWLRDPTSILTASRSHLADPRLDPSHARAPGPSLERLLLLDGTPHSPVAHRPLGAFPELRGQVLKTGVNRPAGHMAREGSQVTSVKPHTSGVASWGWRGNRPVTSL